MRSLPGLGKMGRFPISGLHGGVDETGGNREASQFFQMHVALGALDTCLRRLQILDGDLASDVFLALLSAKRYIGLRLACELPSDESANPGEIIERAVQRSIDVLAEAVHGEVAFYLATRRCGFERTQFDGLSTQREVAQDLSFLPIFLESRIEMTAWLLRDIMRLNVQSHGIGLDTADGRSAALARQLEVKCRPHAVNIAFKLE